EIHVRQAVGAVEDLDRLAVPVEFCQRVAAHDPQVARRRRPRHAVPPPAPNQIVGETIVYEVPGRRVEAIEAATPCADPDLAGSIRIHIEDEIVAEGSWILLVVLKARDRA